MKKLLIPLLFATSAFGQSIEIFDMSRPMRCSKVQVLMEYLEKEHGETMSWVGKDENNSSYLAIYKNKETGSWSLIQFDSTIGCFLGSGKQGSPT